MSESAKKPAEKPAAKHAYADSKNYREGMRVFRFRLPSAGPGGGSSARTSSERRAENNGMRIVEIAEPTERIINDALELAAPFEGSGRTVFMSQAQGYQLRLCLLTIDGQPVGREDLKFENLESYFNEYERSFLVKALEKLSTPTEAEVETFLASMTLVV